MRMVPVIEFHSRPSHSRTWHGSNRHFSSLVTNPESVRSVLTRWDKAWHAPFVFSVDHPSSKKSRRLVALYRQYLTSGRSSLVKICGAVDRPNGRTVKTKYLRVLLSENFQEKPKNVWYSSMVISAFEIKGNHKRIFLKIGQSHFPVLIFYLLCFEVLTDNRKSKISLFFPELCTETLRGLMTSGNWENSNTRPDIINSLIASCTKLACIQRRLII